MENWIVILSVFGIIFYLISQGCFNYVKNDVVESIKFKNNASIIASVGAIIRLLSWIFLIIDLIIILIKIMY